MKAALLTALKEFSVREIPKPEIASDTDVLIRIKMVGVCGSDIHYYREGRIGDQVVKFPFVVGHEAAGIVERTGSKVTRVKAGQRVAIDPAVYCGSCDQCRAGREHTCRKLLFLGCPDQIDGALCEYVVLPEICCFPIKDNTTFEQAVLSEPLAIAVYAVQQAKLPARANVAILGAGPIGMSVFHVLQHKDVADIYVSDKIPERLDYAQQLQAKWCGNPDTTDVAAVISKIQPALLDVVFECSGDPEAYQDAIDILKPGGTFVIVGIPEVDEIPFAIHKLRRREITIINIRRQNHCTQKTIDMLEDKTLQADSLVTHYFPLEKTAEAFELVANYRDGVIKAMISLD
jgi:L-iditol 2-dehydrogenase